MRCHLPPHAWCGPIAELDRAETHYLTHVLRRARGDELDLFDGRGRTASARLVDLRSGHACVEILHEERHPMPAPRLELIQAVPKGKRMELVLEKATELGVAAIRPVLTERTIVRVAEARSERKIERWRDILLSAARQCGTAWLPELHPIETWPALLARRADLPECLILGDLAPGTPSLHAELAAAHQAGAASLAALIGPEGDFTQAEKEAALAIGARPVNLGPTVLRTETAALFMIGAIRYQWL